MTDGNLRALNHHLAEREECDAWQEGRDAIEAMADAEDRIAELEAERDALQVKLDRAIVTLEYFDTDLADRNFLMGSPYRTKARATLAGLKGQTND